MPAKYTHQLAFQISPMMPPRRDGIRSHGPLVLYSDGLDVLVVSPMDHFFSSLVCGSTTARCTAGCTARSNASRPGRGAHRALSNRACFWVFVLDLSGYVFLGKHPEMVHA